MNRPRAHFPVSASVTGVDYTDYLTNDDDGFQKSLGITRKQSDERDISCIAFDPKCSWTSWFYYYEKQLKSCIYEYASRKQKSYLEALQECSRRIAILELVPYYSERATKIDPFVFIPSAQVAIHAARDLEESEKVTIVTRWDDTKNRWGLRDPKRATGPVGGRFSPWRAAILRGLERPSAN